MKNVRKGFRKQRVKRPVEKDVPQGYDSNWESELHQGILDNWDFHTDKVPYVVAHHYSQDFIKDVPGKQILLEATTQFWDHTEPNKNICNHKILPDHQ